MNHRMQMPRSSGRTQIFLTEPSHYPCVMDNLDWQPDWADRPLRFSKVHIQGTLWGYFQTRLTFWKAIVVGVRSTLTAAAQCDQLGSPNKIKAVKEKEKQGMQAPLFWSKYFYCYCHLLWTWHAKLFSLSVQVHISNALKSFQLSVLEQIHCEAPNFQIWEAEGLLCL